jgi:uncharacterized protein YbjT (DUF2867 family)
MIHVFGAVDPPVPRLIAQLAARGASVSAGARAERETADRDSTLVLGPGHELDELALGVLLGAWRKAPGARLLVLSLIGAHPDARAPRLKRMWELEERARGFALPVLTLRLAPLVGPESPLWLKLGGRPRLPRGGRDVIQPVFESDVIETLERALDGRAKWNGWYEVAGPEPLTLAELAALASVHGASRGRGEWEPPLDEIAEQRLAEPEPWLRHFGVKPHAVTGQAAAWAR